MWQITGASIPGSDHTMPGKPGWKNNQDALLLYEDEDVIFGIVSDGCGSGKFSEVGAQIGVRILGKLINESLSRSKKIDFDRIRMKLLGQISVLATSMGDSFSEIINDFFLFSLVGFVVTQEIVTIFYCGDGMYAINGNVTKLGPFPKNAPPYVSYSLAGDQNPIIETVTFETENVDSLAVGTDGTDFVPKLEEELSVWLKTDVLFKNPDVLRRRLALMNLEKIEDGVLTSGPFKDDTTLIIARKL